MISLEDAQTRLLAMSARLPIETVALTQAIGRWAAEDLVAKRTQPARNLSAMDGYAIAHAGLPGPWQVVGESAAGRPFDGVVGAGEAARIFTGAPLPEGTDTIIIQEDVTRNGDHLSLDATIKIPLNHHVRAKGSDFTAGQIIIEAGQRVSPARVGLAACSGYAALPVRARPRVAIISTGDELVPPGDETGDDLLPSSNAVMLAALLADMPCSVTDLGIIPDILAEITAAIKSADADIIVTTGGASVGDHDLVRPALIDAGAHIDFWKIAMRPGKPLMAGRLGNTICLGLPGNPVSAYVTAHLFLRPLIAAMGGAIAPLPAQFGAVLATSLPATGPRTDHVRANVERGLATPIGPNDSAAMAGLANANALIVRMAHSPEATTGDKIEYISLA